MKTLKILSSKPDCEIAMPYRSQGTYKPAWAKTQQTNAVELSRVLPTSKKVAKYEDLDLYHHQDAPDVDFYFVHEGGLIQYGVRVIRYKLVGKLNKPTCGQVSVWRNKLSPDTVGLPKWVSEKLLYSKYGCIISDKVQSEDGENFWIHRIVDALKSGKSVSVLDIDEKHHTLEILDTQMIKSTRDLKRYYTEGEDYSGEHFRFLIE